jgi:hypothetical protein
VARKFCNLNEIILSDNYEKNKRLETLIKTNLNENKIELNCKESKTKIGHFNWCHFESSFIDSLPTIDFIIGSDVFFDNKRNLFHLFLNKVI